MDVKKRTYKWVAERLTRRISQKLIPEGSYLPTERELQEEFGVSRTTIRRALASITESGHAQNVPNKGVVAKSSPQIYSGSRAIAFIDGSLVVLRSLFRTLGGELMRHGYHLIHIDAESIGIAAALQFAQERGCVGAFVWSFEGFPAAESLEALAKASKTMPIIAMDHVIRGVETDVVTFDYFEMARSSAGLLAKAGRKRIAISGMIDMLDVTNERIAGYMKAVFENGLKPDAKDFSFCSTSAMTQGPDSTALRSRLMAENRPDAVFVTQDDFVPCVVQCILDCGLRIPEDVAISTIGDDVALSVGGHELSTTRFDWTDFSRLSLELMLQRIQAPNAPKKRLVAQHSLKVRGTCGTVLTDFNSTDIPGDLVTSAVRPRRHVGLSGPTLSQ